MAIHSIAEALGSRALRTDAVESITCGWLSLVVVIGLLAQLTLGAWWIDLLSQPLGQQHKGSPIKT